MRRKDKHKKIKQLDIVFENCEVFTLTPDMIIACSICGIKNNVGINCFQYENGEVYETISCDEMMLVINEKGMAQKGSFDFPNYTSPLLKKRLKSNDITHFDIIFEDGTNLYIMAPWKDKENNEYHNVLQHNIFQKYSNIESAIIIIDREKLTKSELTKKYEF